MAAAGEGPAGLTASFSAEEQGLIERLRAKYSTGPAPAPAPAPPPAAAAAAAKPAACRLCTECQGGGAVAEAYNHRTLERCCTQCGGQGTVRNAGGSGGSSTHSGNGGSTHNIRASAQSGGTRSSSNKGVHERLAGWEAELEALKQSLAGVTDSQELQLKAALILELERAAAALRKGVAAAKQEGQVLPPPMAQGLAHLSLGGSAGEESTNRSGPGATSSGGAAGRGTAAADPTEASKAAGAAVVAAADSTQAH